MERTTTLILLVLIAFSKCGKLTEEENTKRLQECGNQTLTIPKGNHWPMEMDFPPDKWIVKVFLGEGGYSVKIWWEYTVGSFISPRHILTSSQPLITDKGEWYSDRDNDISAMTYLNETSHLIVPIEEMFGLKKPFSVYLTRNSSLKAKKKDMIRVEKGWILRARNQSDVPRMRSPMILELSENVIGVQYPCLVPETAVLKLGDQVDTYAFKEEKDIQDRIKLYYRHLEIINITEDGRSFGVSAYASVEGRGAPMIRNLDGKTTLIGIAATTGLEYNGTQSDFFDMRHFSKDICSLTGVCPITPTSTTSPDPSPSTTSEVSTSSPDPSAPTSTPSTEPPPALLYTTPPWSLKDRATKASRKPRPPPENNPEYIVDEYEEEEMVIVSNDFWNSSGSVKLNCFSLACLVVGLWKIGFE